MQDSKRTETIIHNTSASKLNCNQSGKTILNNSFKLETDFEKNFPFHIFTNFNSTHIPLGFLYLFIKNKLHISKFQTVFLSDKATTVANYFKFSKC